MEFKEESEGREGRQRWRQQQRRGGCDNRGKWLKKRERERTGLREEGRRAMDEERR